MYGSGPHYMPPMNKVKALACMPSRCAERSTCPMTWQVTCLKAVHWLPNQVLDAADLAKGPVARIPLRHHVPHGLHGYYSEAYFGPGSTDAEETSREEPAAPPPAAGSPGQQLHNNAQVVAPACSQSRTCLGFFS